MNTTQTQIIAFLTRYEINLDDFYSFRIGQNVNGKIHIALQGFYSSKLYRELMFRNIALPIQFELDSVTGYVKTQLESQFDLETIIEIDIVLT